MYINHNSIYNFIIKDRLRSVENRVRRETHQIINGQQVMNLIYLSNKNYYSFIHTVSTINTLSILYTIVTLIETYSSRSGDQLLLRGTLTIISWLMHYGLYKMNGMILWPTFEG